MNWRYRDQYAYGGRVVCAYSQSCSPRCEADVSHCRTWLMPPRLGKTASKCACRTAPSHSRGGVLSCMKSLGTIELFVMPRLFEDLTTCLKDVAQHSIGPTFLVPRIPLSPLSFQGAHCGRDHRRNIVFSHYAIPSRFWIQVDAS